MRRSIRSWTSGAPDRVQRPGPRSRPASPAKGPRSERGPRVAFRCALVCAAISGLFVAGCGRKVTEADCKRVGDHLAEVWRNEAAKEETDGPGHDKATDVLRQEGDRLTQQWLDECRADFVGKKMDPKELNCLLAATTLQDLETCTEK